ncbi:reverse transcriptase family protein [Hyalangium minutum]|uniref:reverse transcriptase family protein n=1 Tax=Hyalangium minutum TaxID=394096 RepID=UPI0012FC6DC4|nr:reverse transcriptase family protein [Hyalangium minutum]
MSEATARTFYSKAGLGFHLKRDWSTLESLAEHAGAHYRSFDEWMGNKWRHFDVPSKRLADVQREIARFLKARVKFPDTMLGGLKGGSPKKNAEAHRGQGLVFKLDIRDCFPSIGHRRVFRMFREQLKFSDPISNLLTKLTTFQNRLPQGSPASSVIANLVLMELHESIQLECEALGLKCTFFVDDITLSGERVREVIAPVVRLVQRHGFSMRPCKVRLLAAHREKLSVTGVLVNRRRLSVGRTRKNKLRARIHQLSRGERVTDSDLRSIQSSVVQVKHISNHQGETLERLVQEKLPKRGVQTPKERAKKIRRVCKCTHKHRHKRNEESVTATHQPASSVAAGLPRQHFVHTLEAGLR